MKRMQKLKLVLALGLLVVTAPAWLVCMYIQIGWDTGRDLNTRMCNWFVR